MKAKLNTSVNDNKQLEFIKGVLNLNGGSGNVYINEHVIEVTLKPNSDTVFLYNLRLASGKCTVEKTRSAGTILEGAKSLFSNLDEFLEEIKSGKL